jgi:hypothetical protein
MVVGFVLPVNSHCSATRNMYRNLDEFDYQANVAKRFGIRHDRNHGSQPRPCRRLRNSAETDLTSHNGCADGSLSEGRPPIEIA